MHHTLQILQLIVCNLSMEIEGEICFYYSGTETSCSGNGHIPISISENESPKA